MTTIRKYCDCRAWPAGAYVLQGPQVFRALRATAKGESPTTAPDAWQAVDLTMGAATPPPNTMTAAPR